MKKRKPFIALLSVNFRQLMNSAVNLGNKSKAKVISGIGSLIFLVLIGFFLGGVYSFILGFAFAPYNALDIMVKQMLLLIFSAAVMFTFFAAQNTIYSTKDIDLVMSLPVSSFEIMLARIVALYLQVFIIVESMILPVGIFYWFLGGEHGAVTFFQLLLLGIFFSVLPSLVGLIGGFITSWVASKVRFKSLINIILSIVIIGLFMYAVMSSMSSVGSSVDVQAINDNIPWFISVIANSVVGFHPLQFLLVILVCTVPFLLLCWLFSLNFRKILSGLTNTHRKNNYVIKGLKKLSPFGALLKKEATRFLGTPILLLNSGIGSLILVVGAFVTVFLKGTIDGYLQMPEFAGVGQMLPVVVLGILIFVIGMIMISSSSISLERNSLWILRESPVSTKTIFAAKGGFNAIVDIISCIIAIPLIGYALSFSVLDTVLIFIVCVLYSIFSSYLGLFINLLFPKLDAENDAVVVKQSSSTLICMIFDFIYIGALVGVYILTSIISNSFFAFSIAAMLITAIFMWIVFLLLKKVGVKNFSKLAG